MAEIKTELNDEELKELEDLKRKLIAKYDEYPRYKIPFLSAEEREILRKNRITDEEFDKAFNFSMGIHKDQHINPGIPIIPSTEIMLLPDDAAVGYVVGKEDNNVIVICKASGLSSLSSLLGDSFFGGVGGSKEEYTMFEAMCKQDTSDAVRMGICGFINGGIFIHHFRPIIMANSFID